MVSQSQCLLESSRYPIAASSTQKMCFILKSIIPNLWQLALDSTPKPGTTFFIVTPDLISGYLDIKRHVGFLLVNLD